MPLSLRSSSTSRKPSRSTGVEASLCTGRCIRRYTGQAATSKTRCRKVTAAAASEDGTPARPKGPSLADRFMNLFPLWVLLGCLSGLWFPSVYAGFYRPVYITTMLAATMLCMGFTLTMRDITDVLKRPGLVTLGAALQYTIMPALGFAISKIPAISPEFAAGIIIVSCCPGGTASNIITYLAKADVGLSVMMTTASTLAAVVMTPVLTTQLIGTVVPVDGMALFKSTLQVVLAPVLSGIALNRFFPTVIARIAPFAPPIAVLMVTLTVATVMAQASAAVRGAGGMLLLGCFLLHSGGFLLGYLASRAFGLPERTCRTNSIEVGMQNSTLGASLALMHFGDPRVAAPCAISACMHSIIGSLLAGVWQRVDPEAQDAERLRGAGTHKHELD